MDIVERLGELRLGNTEYEVVVGAINEIELLRKERDGLREALKVICQMPIDSDSSFEMTTIARAALKETE